MMNFILQRGINSLEEGKSLTPAQRKAIFAKRGRSAQYMGGSDYGSTSLSFTDFKSGMGIRKRSSVGISILGPGVTGGFKERFDVLSALNKPGSLFRSLVARKIKEARAINSEQIRLGSSSLQSKIGSKSKTFYKNPTKYSDTFISSVRKKISNLGDVSSGFSRRIPKPNSKVSSHRSASVDIGISANKLSKLLSR